MARRLWRIQRTKLLRPRACECIGLAGDYGGCEAALEGGDAGIERRCGIIADGGEDGAEVGVPIRHVGGRARIEADAVGGEGGPGE